MNRTTMGVALATTTILALSLAGCKKAKETPVSGDGQGGKAAAAAPTNRVDIPAAVRKNLGITFAKVETRNVARTLRVPGRFELLPTARREYRPAMPGRVELLVSQYQKVEAGTPLYRIDSPRWRELQDQIATAEASGEQAAARLASIAPVRESQRLRAESLTAGVAILNDRAVRMEELQASGAGTRKDLDEAKGALSKARAELAEVSERRAELDARERELRAESRSLGSRVELLVDSAASLTGITAAALRDRVQTNGGERPRWHTLSIVEVRAAVSGIVESIGVTNGSAVESGALVLSTVQPELIRFHAQGLQGDLGRLRDGLTARVVPPGVGSVDTLDSMEGTLQLGLGADPDDRTIDLLLTPTKLSTWARSGVSGYLEVILEGGTPDLAIPLSSVTRDGTRSIIFRRDPADPAHSRLGGPFAAVPLGESGVAWIKRLS